MGRLKMNCLYVARNMTKCSFTRVVSLRRVSVSGGSTVFFINNCYIGTLKLLTSVFGCRRLG